MANIFKSIFAENVGTSNQPIINIPASNASKGVVIGLQLTNTHASAEIKADIVLRKNITTSYHTVTTATSSGNPAYQIDGSFTPTITIKKGHIYVFDVSDSSNANHVLGFSSATPSGTVSAISGAVASGTPGEKGAIVTWTVPTTVTAAWYYCTAHAYNNKMNTAPTAFTVSADTAEDSFLLKEVKATCLPLRMIFIILSFSNLVSCKSSIIIPMSFGNEYTSSIGILLP